MTNQIISLFLALIFLVASNTYAVTSHFCHGNLVDISYLGSPNTCGMEQNDQGNGVSQVKNNCCSDSTQILESDMENLTLKDSQSVESVDLVASIIEKQILNIPIFGMVNGYHSDKSPPDLYKDFQVLFQTFLI